ncbi:hypothetical protein K488DRAFT_83327 [Vararia minispora EC-137]|uniref:Uncharacterized protein n=1 Tax=Vararia minispora EC-137 TaxID=1314806 RepID=A0ACB8QUU1_9AGAM|nr:hypothetical protein K488DRAFT_83327 [Vararia minispora EC-137]
MFRALLSRVPSSAVLEVEDDTIALNVEAVRALLPAPPHLRVPWRAVCESMFAGVTAEIESTVRVLAALEDIGDAPIPLSCDPSALEAQHQITFGASSSLFDSLGLNGHSLPKIIITPCDEDNDVEACWVPLQDACFGNRLVVPAQPVVNGAFPPLALPKTALPPTRRWEYKDGHWCAVLPSFEEQARRSGLTRMLTPRKRRLTR